MAKRTTSVAVAPKGTVPQGKPLVTFRPYQEPVFRDRKLGILLLHWSRQIGKSFTLAAWAVDRLLKQLQENDRWLITVLSNSRDNGAEFVLKAQEVCDKIGQAMVAEDQSPDLKYENMRMEVRLTVKVDGRERIGRIKVLAANPRTARGFSGDLILDEFAFHEDSNAIWEAAEPILSSNPEFLCRISSTGNGKHNMFYRMTAMGLGAKDGGEICQSAAGFAVSRCSRTAAHRLGVKVYDPNTRLPITPEEARKKALDKRAYDQNYELAYNDENMALLTFELISAAERQATAVIDEQAWSAESLARMARCPGRLELGMDVGRHRDISVQCVLERVGNTRRLVGMLRMLGMRLPDQQRQLDAVCGLRNFHRGMIDMTGIGLGLVEYAQERWGGYRIAGVNFGTSEPVSAHLKQEGRKAETARVTEIMAVDLLGVFEERSLELHVLLDQEAREDLRKPERIVGPGGRVSVAAVRDEAGHADTFWSLALAVRAGQSGGPFAWQRVEKRKAGQFGRERIVR